MCTQSQRIGTFAACLMAFSLIMVPTTVWANEGGGGGGGGGGSSAIDQTSGGTMGGSQSIAAWGQSELENIFKDVDPKRKGALIDAYRGTTITRRQLLLIRQSVFQESAREADRNTAILDTLMKTLQVLDTAGQYSQLGLSFVPGVGWVTSTSLGAARAAADGYRDGKTGSEIAADVLIDGAASAIVGAKFSSLNANGALSMAKRSIKLTRTSVVKGTPQKAAKIAVKALGRYGTIKAAEIKATDALKSVVTDAAQAVGAKNMAVAPSYRITTPSGLTM